MMYNRYIPQQDGSYQRRPAPDKAPAPPKPPQQPPQNTPPPAPPPAPQIPPGQPQTAGSFLRSLLPREFDTGDLIVVLLLLLMAGDCEQERNTALLTLALYFLL